MASIEPTRPDYAPTPAPDAAEQPVLRALARLVRRRWLVILIPLIAIPFVAYSISSHQTKQYQATATLLFQDTAGGQQLASGDPAREAATNISVLQSGLITQRAMKKLGGTEGSVSFTNSADANLVQIDATSRTPQRTADLANGVATEYIKFRQRQTQSQLAAQETRINQRIAQLKGSTRTADKRQKKTLTGIVRGINLKQATLAPDVRQLGVATAPSSPSSPHPTRSALIGILLGLAIGFGIAFALERLDLRVRDPREFETAFGRPILGRIPRSRALSKTPPGEWLPPMESQAFADLRAKLRHHVGSPNGHAKSVVITSAQAAEGKTTVAWHLACAAAGPHQRVLLIEADLRRPGLSAKLRTDGTPGLSDVLQGDAAISEAVRQVPIGTADNTGNGNGNTRHRGTREPRTVDVLFAGSPAGDPTGLLESPEMRDFMKWAIEVYDLVLIDTPPTSVANDAVPLVTRTDGVIVVGRLAKSRVAAVADLSKQLREINAPTVGIVVNSSEVERHVYDYYYARPRD
jgi:succinoglycan biosynthesis transport protein ExoP